MPMGPGDEPRDDIADVGSVEVVAVIGDDATSYAASSARLLLRWWRGSSSSAAAGSWSNTRRSSPASATKRRPLARPTSVRPACLARDRKSVVWGTRGAVRVDLGGRRIIKK